MYLGDRSVKVRVIYHLLLSFKIAIGHPTLSTRRVVSQDQVQTG